MPIRVAGVPARAALLALAVTLGACTESHVPEEGRYVMAGTSIQDSMRVLLDPARQLYLFHNRVCRELGKLPSPWRRYSSKRYEKPGPWGKYPPGYDWGPMISVDSTELTLEAPYAQLGFPPANDQRFGLGGNVALLALAPSLGERAYGDLERVHETLLAAMPDWHVAQPIPFTTSWGLPRIWVPMKAPFPVSDRFGVYTQGPDHLNDKSPLMIINPALRAGVYCNHDFTWPRGSCMGVILLNDDELATIRVSYEALGKLDEVVESMIGAIHAIRVNCPGDEVTP